MSEGEYHLEAVQTPKLGLDLPKRVEVFLVGEAIPVSEPALRDPKDILSLIDRHPSQIRKRPYESALGILLNDRFQVIGILEAGRGLRSSSLVDTRTLVYAALAVNAAGMILVHNHPSNDCRPSKADLRITRVLGGLLSMLEMILMDHIIVGIQPDENYCSFRKSGLRLK